MQLDLSNTLLGILLPIVLLATTAFVFSVSARRYGQKAGYFIGFLFYWIVWCLIVPLRLIPSGELKSLFQLNLALFNESKWLNLFCLLLPLLFAYSYAFPKALKAATVQIIAYSLVLAIVNATMEEILWRGLFLKLFTSDKWTYIILSSIGFAIWHFAPQLIYPNKAPGGQISFVLFALLFGIVYSIVAFNTRSILLVTLSHIFLDFSGLGARVYLHPKKLI